MQLVEQHCIDKSDGRFEVIDRMAFASKNLYNAALYEMRQAYIHHGHRIFLNDLYHLMKSHEAYKVLPAKVAQQVLKLLDKNWKSYEEACKAWQEDSHKFVGHPKLPGYKDKQKGRNVLVFTIQAVSKRGLTKGLIQPSGVPIEIHTAHAASVNCVRIVPHGCYYVVEVVYEQEATQADVDPSLMASIDVGLNNLVALTSNKVGFVPRLVNGRPIKSVNQFYNKRKAQLQQAIHLDTRFTRSMEALTIKRTRRIDHYLHTASRRIVDLLIAEGIGTLIIGKNPLWKQHADMGKRNNQNFVQVPHARFIAMLTYKCHLVGIQVIIGEESYTSKASFLDGDTIPVYGACEQEPVFSGRRVKRGLYKSKNGKKFNADVNGSYNILRKVAPNALCNGVEDAVVVHPVRLHV